MKKTQSEVYFVDTFTVPTTSLARFVQQMNCNRAFVASLPGYLRGEVFKREADEEVVIIAIAVWESIEKLQHAKHLVKAEFDRIGFDPVDFYRQLSVRMKREQYMDLLHDDGTLVRGS